MSLLKTFLQRYYEKVLQNENMLTKRDSKEDDEIDRKNNKTTMKIHYTLVYMQFGFDALMLDIFHCMRICLKNTSIWIITCVRTYLNVTSICTWIYMTICLNGTCIYVHGHV